jgi:iron complex outermembrane receptor protein
MHTSLLAVAVFVFASDPPRPKEKGSEDEQVGQTLVTARKRAETIDRVPASVTSVSAEEIEASGMRSVSDAAQLVPNLNITEFTSRRLSFPFVRGVGSGQGEAGVVTYIDGVPQLTTGSTNLPLVGLDRVEFVRGPQGVLYGRNALGGVIHVHSRRPSATPEYGVRLGLGSSDLQELSASFSGPIGIGGGGADGPLFDLSVQQSTRSGYTTNLITGNEVDHRDAFFGRAQMLLTPSDDSEVRIALYSERSRDGGFALQNVYPGPLGPGLKNNPHQITQDFEGVVERDIFAPSVNWTVFGDTVEFTSITAYQDWDVLETSDFDFSPLDLIRRTTMEDQAYLSQELRFASSEQAAVRLGDDVSMSWLTGVQAFVADSGRSAANDFRAPIPPQIPVAGIDYNAGDFDDFGLGVFGEATLLFGEDVEVTGGLRYDHESKEADLENIFYVGGFRTPVSSSSPDEDYGELLPSFSVAWHRAEDTTWYVSASKGYKAGGFNLTSAPAGKADFDPEKNWSYEVGFKSSFGDVDVRVAGFYIDWSDMQLTVAPTATTGPYVDNAGDSTSMGGECEVVARAGEHLAFFGGVGVTKTEFDSYVDPYLNDVSGESLPFAPETNWSAGAQVSGDLDPETGWYARAEYVAVGDFYYDANNTQKESYELVNATAGIERRGWSLSVWARNLFDEEYIPVALQVDPTNPAVFVGESGEPMVAGLTFSASF